MLSSVTISEPLQQVLSDLSVQEQLSIEVILAKAIESYRRQSLLNKANQAFAQLKKNPPVWQQELEERVAWETTLSDGLEET
jgi:molybdopterin synthase catalytic subunit